MFGKNMYSFYCTIDDDDDMIVIFWQQYCVQILRSLNEK